MTIGNQIELLIKKNKITRLQLSKDTGIPYTTLTQIINGRTKNPQVKALEIIADYFNVSLDYILGNSASAIVEKRLSELNITFDELSKRTGIPKDKLATLDTFLVQPEDYEQDGFVTRLVKALEIEPEILIMAFMRQSFQLQGSVNSPNSSEKFETLAAHHDGEDWTEEELEEIERFKEFVKMRRQQRNKG